MENIHFLIKKTNREYFLEQNIKSYKYLIKKNLLQIYNGKKKIFQKDLLEKIHFFTVENKKIFFHTENHFVFFNGKNFLKIKSEYKKIQYCKIINGDILAVQTTNSIILFNNNLEKIKIIENIDSSIFLKTEFLFFCVRNNRIFFMQLNGEFHNEIISLSEIEKNIKIEYVDYNLKSITGDKLIHTILNIEEIFVLCYYTYIIFLKYENGQFYMKKKLNITSSENSIRYHTNEYFVVDNLKIRIIKTINCLKKLFIRNRNRYLVTDFIKSCLPLPLYHNCRKKLKKEEYNFKLTKNYFLKFNSRKIKVEKYRFIRKIKNSLLSAVQINNTLHIIWNNYAHEQINNISSFFLHKNYLIILKNRILKFYKIKLENRLEKKYEQKIFENATILSCFNSKIIFFIKRGNFEIQYPKFLIENKIRKMIKNKSERNFDGIFYEMKKHIIQFNFIKKKYKEEILNCKIDYLIEYFKINEFTTNKKKISDFLFKNVISDEYLIKIFQQKDISHKHIILLLIYCKYYDIIIHYINYKGTLENDITLLKKFISEDELIKNILRTYDEKIIREFYTILGLEYSFSSNNLKIEVNEYLNDPVEKLKYIEDVEDEIAFIKKHNLFEEALSVCGNKQREKNFYYKLYSKNTVGEKSVQILFSVHEYDLAIERAVLFLEYMILHEIYEKINKEYILSDKYINIIYKKLEENNYYIDLGKINFLLGDFNNALIYTAMANDFVNLYNYAEKITDFTDKFKEIYWEKSEIYCINNFEKLDLISESYNKYFKKFNSLQEYMDCDEMTASTISSLSLLKGYKGIKKKLFGQKIKYEAIMNDLILVPKIDNMINRGRNELYEKIFKYENDFKILLNRVNEIIFAGENFL